MSETTLRSFGYEQELKRSLSLADLIIYGLVFMVPIAPFAIFGVVFNGSEGMVPLTYIIGLVALLFIAQTHIASLLAGGRTSFAEGDATNSAFYDIAGIAGGTWLKTTVAVASALATGIANSLVAQAATSRLLFSMARDRKLPAFLAHVHAARKIPERAILLVSVLSLGLGLFFVGQVELISSLVNFGAPFAFLLLHVSVFVHFVLKNGSRRWHLHLVAPALGFVIIGYVLYHADTRAKVGGVIWLIIGVALLVFYRLTGRGTGLSLED